jgi:tyrosyl-tRNA synthetase
VQIGGSDQWGNITAGIDLIRRLSGNSVFGITLPLVTKSDGSKFGKTESGTIWLDAAKTSPYEMYQFWLNASDQDSIRFSRYFTFLSQEEIAELERATLDSPGRREAQRTLAQEVTRIVHGASALAEAEYITNAFFNNTIHDLTDHLLKQAFLNAPRLHLEHDQTSVDLIDLLVGADMAPSKGRARRLIQDGAVQINGNKITDINASFSRNDALFQRYLIIRKGKKHYYLASWD